jgi:hypothetical protein
MAKTLLRAARWIAFVSFIATGMSLWAIGYLDDTYVGYPRQLDSQTSRTVSVHVKGIEVYVTPREKEIGWIVRLIQYVSMAVFVVTVVFTWGKAVTKGWPWRDDSSEKRGGGLG